MIKQLFFSGFILISNICLGINLSRELSSIQVEQGGSVIVHVKVSKSGIDGVGKLLEEIPAGFSFQVLNSANGRVLVDEGGRLKIIWLTLPIADQFEIKYRLIHHGKTKGDYLIRGQFSYVEGTYKKTYELAPTKLSITEGLLTNQKSKTVESGVLPATKISEEKEVNHKVKVRKEESKFLPVNAEATGNFVIQLGVYSSEKDPRVFKGLPDIHYVRVKQFFKYYSGHYPSKEAAQSRLSDVKKVGFEEAFVAEMKP